MHARQESRDEDDIDRHLAMLHADFNCLACLLALVEESAAHLKLIFNRVNDTHVPSFTPSSSVSNLDIANLEEGSSGNINLNESFGNVLGNVLENIDENIGNVGKVNPLHSMNKGSRMDRRNAAALKMYENTKDALMDCLNHISKSFELFLKHINTNPKLQEVYYDENNDIEQKTTSDGSDNSKKKPTGKSTSSLLNDYSLPNSDLISAFSRAENQILKIIRLQEDCKVRNKKINCIIFE
jgi:hypothetical protein